MVKKKVKRKGADRRKILYLIGILALLAIASYMWSAGYLTPKPKFEFQKGICYVSWNKDRYLSPASDRSLEALAKTGATWVSLLTTWYQERCDTTKIFPTDKTPSDESIIHTIEMAHSLGMKVMLKPHLDILDTAGGSWRGEVGYAKDFDWEAWFDSYRDLIIHYAKIAQKHKVEILCIGTELTSVAIIKENLWKEKIIKPVRAIYKGPLTYAANWNEEYMRVKFWDALDYVGIDAYFPLTDNRERPTLEELRQGWEKWVKEIEAFRKMVNKPVIFPEVGYCSAKGTAKIPWEEMAGGALDLELQADCYQALLETFWDRDWFYGVYWWRWGTDVRLGGATNRGFSFQNKPAQNVVVKWYKKAAPEKYKF